MAQTSWPFHDGTSGTPVLEDQWSKMARTWSQSGVIDYGNKLAPYSDSDGRQVKVSTGRAIVRGHYYENTPPTVVLAIAANASGNPRIDRVVLRLDPSANSVTLTVLQGTPAGSPSAPALTQTDVGVFEISLARVTVANGATNIVPADVIDERTFIGPPLPLLGGTMTGALTLSGAPTSALHAATRQYVDDKGTWSSWTPTVTGSTSNPTSFISSETSRFTRHQNTVHFRSGIMVVTGGTGGSGSVLISLPASLNANYATRGPIGQWSWRTTQGVTGNQLELFAGIMLRWNATTAILLRHSGSTLDLPIGGEPSGGTYSLALSGTYEAAP